jgi:zinc transport system permease protein
MILSFFLHALIAGVLLAVSAAPLGCFVLWRRMAYFGDAVAHAALLGVVLGVSFKIPVMLAVVPVALLMAFLLQRIGQRGRFSADTLLGILAHLGLALGVTLLALDEHNTVDISAILFGDILAVSATDLLIMTGLSAIVLLTLWRCWMPLVAITVSEELARIRGIQVERCRLLLMLLIALTVAIAMKLVGLLLVTSMLIMPAATARAYARSPLEMVLMAALIAVLNVGAGLGASFVFDTPSGPSIVLASGLLLGMTTLAQLLKPSRASA